MSHLLCVNDPSGISGYNTETGWCPFMKTTRIYSDCPIFSWSERDGLIWRNELYFEIKNPRRKKIRVGEGRLLYPRHEWYGWQYLLHVFLRRRRKLWVLFRDSLYRRAVIPKILRSIGKRLDMISNDSVETDLKDLVIKIAAVRWTDLSSFKFCFLWSAADHMAQP